MDPTPAGPPGDDSPSLLGDLAPEVASGILTTSLVVLVAAMGILIVVMFWAHASRVSRGRRIERILAPLRPRLLALAAEEDPTGVDPVRPGRTRARVMDRAVLDLLGKVRGDTVGALVQILDDHGTVAGAMRGTRSLSPTTRARSAQVLGATRRRAHGPALAALLSDRDRAVRSTAVRALGVLGDATYADAVLRAVREVKGSPGVPAYVAADALMGMGDDVREAVRRGLDDPDAGVRLVAAMVAARGGMAGLVPRLRQLLREDADPRVRAAAARTLGAVGDRAVLDDLARALAPGEPAAVRSAAAHALGEVGASSSIEVLTPALSDPDRRLAAVAADALAALGGPGRDGLVRALGEGSPPAEISLADPSREAPEDLAALAALGAVTALGIRGRRPDLYDLAVGRRAGDQAPSAHPHTHPHPDSHEEHAP